MCPAKLETLLMLSSGRLYPKVKLAIRDINEHIRHTSGPVECDEVSYPTEEEQEGVGEEAEVVGRASKGKAKAARKGKSKDSNNAWKVPGTAREMGIPGRKSVRGSHDNQGHTPSRATIAERRGAAPSSAAHTRGSAVA